MRTARVLLAHLNILIFEMLKQFIRTPDLSLGQQRDGSKGRMSPLSEEVATLKMQSEELASRNSATKPVVHSNTDRLPSRSSREVVHYLSRNLSIQSSGKLYQDLCGTSKAIRATHVRK